MSSWRDTILGNFAPKASKLTLAADPDNLLTEEKLAFELRGRGFGLNAWGYPRYANTVTASVIARKLSGDMNCNPRGSSCQKSGHC